MDSPSPQAIGAGVAVAGAIAGFARWLVGRDQVREMRIKELDALIETLRRDHATLELHTTRCRERHDTIEGEARRDMRGIAEAVARIEGLIEALRHHHGQ